jgi:hypothetical protein
MHLPSTSSDNTNTVSTTNEPPTKRHRRNTLFGHYKKHAATTGRRHTVIIMTDKLDLLKYSLITFDWHCAKVNFEVFTDHSGQYVHTYRQCYFDS